MLLELEGYDGELERIERRADAVRLKKSLHDFVVEAWSIIEPDIPFVDNWHIVVLCDQLEKLARGEIKRMVINIPPGTMKSLLVSVFFPAWVWTWRPGYKVLSAAYGAHLTTRDNLRVRQIVDSKWYQDRFDVTLVADQNTKTRYNTTAGGWRIATSVGGVGTGEHPDLILIDDALTAGQAESEPERTAANLWFDRTITTRGVSRNASIIVLGQRLHEDDLPGYLLAKNRASWVHICWPMRYMVARPETPDDPGYTPDPLDPRTSEGELLFPALFDELKVALLEVDLGAYGTAGQLQQQPAPEGGGDFKREFFKFVDAPPKIARRVRGWDTAGTQDGGDWTVGVRLSEEFDYLEDEKGRKTLQSTGRFFIEDVVRGQWSPDVVDLNMRVTTEADGKATAVREEQEGGASGKAVIAARTKLLKGFDYAAVHLGMNKRLRAKPLRAQAQGGNVYLVRGEWNETFIKELCLFPTGKHDDQVDGASTAFNAVLMEPPPKPGRAVWGSKNRLR